MSPPVTVSLLCITQCWALGPGCIDCLSEHLRNFSIPPSLRLKPSEQLLVMSLLLALKIQG